MPVNKIIIQIGQSNSRGTAPMVELPVQYQGAKQHLRFWNTGGFQCANSAVNNNQFQEQNNSFAYEFNLINLSGYLNEDIYVLKYAVGGTILANENWGYGSWNINRNERYLELLTYIQSVKSWMNSRNKEYEFFGVIWHQGETDCSNLTRSEAYQVNELDFINGVNAAIGSTPFWYNVQIHSGLGRVGDADVIAAKTNNVATNLSKYRLINQNDCPLQVDNTHLTADGYNMLGQILVESIKLDL